MKRVHFIGIGGIGISALARCFLFQGWQVSGSDSSNSEIVNDLKKEGIRITIGQNEKNINKSINLIVHTAAVRQDNPELKKAEALSIKAQSYPQALGELTKKYWTVAISGSHGKSTTTSMLSLVLIKAGFDPTVIVGTKLKEFKSSTNNESGTNFRMGKSRYLIIEADEWNKSFLNYWPQVIVLTNIDKEHLDTYSTEAGVVKTFSEYVSHLPKNGILIANWQDKNSRKVALGSGRKVIFYNKKKPNHKLLVPGVHNRLNAEAAWQAARALGVKKSVASLALTSYQGAWRRLEKIQNFSLREISRRETKFKNQNLYVYSDYAHHPNEIKATLQALREKYPSKKITCVFQPHQADRLTRLFSDFVGAFKDTDELILLPVYRPKGREALKNEKTSRDLFNAVKKKIKTYFCDRFNKIESHMKSPTANDIWVFMSAGDLDDWTRQNI